MRMENGVIYIITLSAVVAFSSFVMYDSERARASKFALGVIMLAALLIPIAESIKDFSPDSFFSFETEEYDTGAAEEILEASFCRGVKLAVCEEFSLPSESVEVYCDGFDMETVKAKTVYVVLSGKAVFSDIPSIRDYIEKEGLGKAEVEVSFE